MTWLRSTIGLIVTGLTILLLVVGFLYLQSCADQRRQAAQNRVDKGQGKAGVDAGGVAMNTMGNVMAGDDATDANVKGGRDEILAKPAGNSNDAAVRAACRLRQYVNSERCARLRRADSANAAGTNPAR